MTNATGLQTGNLVLYAGLVHRLQTIGHWCHTDITVDEIPLDKIEPIPLTEEWLEKFGAHKIAGNYILDRFCFIWKESYKYWYVVDDSTNAYLTKIDMVHHLQNFYNGMNQTELTASE